MRPRPIRRSFFALPLLAALLLGGCAMHRPLPGTSAPAWEAPTAAPDPASDAWLAEQQRPAESSGDALGTDALRRLVVQRHPRVAAAEAEVARARAHAQRAGAWENPVLEGRLLLRGPAAPGLEASLTERLPISGRIAAERRAAAAGRERAEVALEAARQAALLEADSLLAALACTTRRLALAQDVAEFSARLAALVRERQAAGLADPLEAAMALGDASRDAGALAMAEAARTRTDTRLRLLAGLSPDGPPLAAPPQVPARIAEERDTLLADATLHNAGWAMARLDAEQAAWERLAAARALVPEPRLGPVVSGDPENPSVGLTVGLPLPLLAPGGARLREARAAEDAAAARLAAISRQTAWEIDEILSRGASLDAALQALTTQSLESTRQAARLARERYAAGQLDMLHLVTLQRDWARLEAEHLDLLLESRQALLDLERAVGRPIRTEPIGPDAPEVLP